MVVIFALLIGSALALLMWSTYRIVDDVPQEDRSYLDRPPLGFRLTWPCIKMFVHYFGSLLSLRYRLATQARLRKAGVDYMLSPEQYFAGKLLSSVVGGGFFILIINMLNYSITVATISLAVVAAVLSFAYPDVWLRDVSSRREKHIFKSLPFYLDVIVLSVEAGTNLTGAFTQAVQRAPDGPLRSEFSRMLRDIRAGKSRADALRSMGERIQMEAITSFVSSVIQAERMGASMGQVLRAQADQRRTERFLRAEKQAMEAPVKLLAPLIMFIFPTTFMVIVFVLIVKAAQAGVLTWKPLLWALSWPVGS